MGRARLGVQRQERVYRPETFRNVRKPDPVVPRRRDSSLADLPGFVNFTLLRREGDVDDGNTYVSYTVWKDVQAFNNWRGSDNFKRSHSGPKAAESPYAKMPKVVTYKTFLTCGADEGM